ncbi:beta-2 adrenergic receptor [Episyrphus balteatus]|uniref:beta-2 adrenergic receptor n=1 Tax=Episyrphus balteatus TaxID=286459 RepID=UPI002484DF75|nr:beta-2 adrenergic receptor [Episyrphus balteatus]XP_055841733.1 beta-2 adrenergic receptor [Episyrphus balteatus]XP_055841734.1 beta-2 adrenergic receptor [Episyrphus balteatus]XP_055841735.1 beta-2 adrenergic receptor [Episyrphus balteatus]XP_055910118.1 beta-2 adrenergic receptor [Eupeodes corollae]XP_055910119.1 beta-2 adrenergic receptor [Eupeodes corollae]
MQGMSYLQDDSKLEALTQAALICILGIAIVFSNLLIIATYANFKGPTEVINYYLLSLAVADLLCGLMVVPFSVYPALLGEWMYGDILCRFTGYLEVTLWAVSVYTFMWISVDRYLAVRKPLRYETVQTKTRCQCWMAFTWISAALLCCPPILGYNTPIFHPDSHICMLDWGNMAAYSVTLSILILGPSVISIVHNYGYIFVMMRKLRSGEPIHDKEYATALAENLSNPSHMMSFALVFAFWISWLPLISVRIYEVVTGHVVQNTLLNFGLVWIGVLNSFWKIIIMTGMSPQFRIALRVFCLTICCKTKGRLQAELIGLDPDD